MSIDSCKLLQNDSGLNAILPLDEVEIRPVPFLSPDGTGGQGLEAVLGANRSLLALIRYYLSRCPLSQRLLFGGQSQVNASFDYYVLRTRSTRPEAGAVVMLHGLNEKSWGKYLPWALWLLRETRRTVVLFPLAYHMNRAPEAWADPRAMRDVVKERQSLFPELEQASFANAALSQRLQLAPQLFLQSGRQSYHDLVAWMRQVRAGQLPFIAPQAPVDLFAYSIGASLAEMLMMTTSSRLFGASRGVFFCGGATLNRTQPANKTILDSEASLSLHQYIDLLRHAPLEEMSGLIPAEQRSLAALLQRGDDRRRWRSLSGRTLVMGLEGDQVFPAEAMQTTFKPQGEAGPDLRLFDFPYAQRHENPFPSTPEGALAMEEVMTLASDHFRSAHFGGASCPA